MYNSAPVVENRLKKYLEANKRLGEISSLWEVGRMWEGRIIGDRGQGIGDRVNLSRP
jgi:hypothetical protein